MSVRLVEEDIFKIQCNPYKIPSLSSLHIVSAVRPSLTKNPHSHSAYRKVTTTTITFSFPPIIQPYIIRAPS